MGKTVADSEDEDGESESKERPSDLKFESDESANPVLAASPSTAKKRIQSFKDEKTIDLPGTIKEVAEIPSRSG